MLKLAAAIAAITTLGGTMACVMPVAAQQVDLKPVKPTSAPQPIDVPADNAHPSVLGELPGTNGNSPTVTVGANTKVESVSVHARTLVIAGTVNHDVHVSAGRLVLVKGANIGGQIEVDDRTTVENHSSLKVNIVPHVETPVPGESADTNQESASNSDEETHVSKVRNAARNVHYKPDWFQAQLALAIFGVLSAGLAGIIAPNASRKVADHVWENPNKDLKIGAVLGVAMLTIVTLDALLLKMPLLKYLWAPFGIMIAFAPVLLLGFGWVTGMRYAGDMIATKLNRPAAKSQFRRVCFGIFACFILSVFLGVISPGLGVAGLFLELGIALMGLGGAASLVLRGPAGSKL